MTPMFFKPCGGEIAFDDRPQEIMCRITDRCGGYIANNGPGVLSVFMGDVVSLPPFKAVQVPIEYQGPVKISGHYMDRFTAMEFIREPVR